MPKWHDATCESILKEINLSSNLLKKDPKNQYIKSQLLLATKQYKKMLKSKQKEYLEGLFNELDSLKNNNPRGYMNIVKSLKSGSFDKKVSDDSSFVPPDDWKAHFQDMLGPPVPPEVDEDLSAYIEENCDQVESELGVKITKSEFLASVSSLDNNKSTSFDKISNEMLKAGKLILAEQILVLFNSVQENSIYPTQWGSDILSPLHKKGGKSDPNNFRGISVSSCLGKLFNKILQRRLEKLCSKNNFINDEQGSGKAKSRTADHLLIVKFLVDKYVNGQGKKIFACFVDLQMAYDTVPRVKLFHSLLKNYAIGGKFLRILQQIYTNNMVSVKLTDGLLQPFRTTIGVKQGCVFSPILFNLFINKITEIFDGSCDPLTVNNKDINCLLWADDLLLVSSSPSGLQNSLTKMGQFYDNLALKVNLKKNQVIVFNKSGKKLDNKFHFTLDGKKVQSVDEYQYLGLKLRPSGSMSVAVQELHDKASRAWFGISNVIYKNERMEVEKIFNLFDSLVTPVTLCMGASFGSPVFCQKKVFL